ncbi:MAG: hypothetical protein AB7O43_09695, partial [Hyphomicrobiaceae bacterium]
LVFAVPALILALFALAGDVRGLAKGSAAGLPSLVTGGTGFLGSEFGRSVLFFGWLIGIFAITILVGQHIALPLMIAFYLLVWGRFGWWVALIYAAAGLAVLVGIFDYMSPTAWYPAIWDWQSLLPG